MVRLQYIIVKAKLEIAVNICFIYSIVHITGEKLEAAEHMEAKI